ncbi:GNAT family N-acetyltransferase [Nocardia huaxiensis]|uniref:GNAT family N-acetyltransferase n=1 Tax=Nocardia huaxiensis TaxID=2755382 RepID=A0A7D6V5H9_9NOCA|nr:GNAT family protein [Nocardia huaxiensis]QLY27941.1 GNAT family N-acetyltransferase [Nocardia huaxiensis]UFS98648.1 GNAT family N-acetyltransferase [Nocardia huaxiensis]
MIWPFDIAASGLTDGQVSLREYRCADAEELFEALRDDRAWEHIPREIPRDAAEFDARVRAGLPGLERAAFTIRQRERVVGGTSIFYDPATPGGVEIGATQFDPAVWGTGVNTRAKHLLMREIFARGADWIQFRTDERNGRSAAAIRKLGATDLGVRQDDLVRRDGSVRRSRWFRLDRPAG